MTGKLPLLAAGALLSALAWIAYPPDFDAGWAHSTGPGSTAGRAVAQTHDTDETGYTGRVGETGQTHDTNPAGDTGPTRDTRGLHILIDFHLDRHSISFDGRVDRDDPVDPAPSPFERLRKAYIVLRALHRSLYHAVRQLALDPPTRDNMTVARDRRVQDSFAPACGIARHKRTTTIRRPSHREGPIAC